MEFDLAEHLVGREGIGLLPRSEQAQLKSYVLEAHEARAKEDAQDVLTTAVVAAAGSLEPTADPTLFTLRVPVETDAGMEQAGFWVDVANPRFWLLHTKTKAKPAGVALRRLLLMNTGLDAAWLPRSQLRQVQHTFRPFGFKLAFDERPFYNRDTDVVELREPTHKLAIEHAGVGAEEMYALLEERELTRRALAVSEVSFWDRTSEGVQVMRLTREGRLRSAGTSLDSHLHAARNLVRLYEDFVLSLERIFGIRLLADDTSIMIEGRPLSLDARKPEGFEFEQLVSRMFSGIEPFRLLGTVDWRESDLAWVEAIDLHTGAPLRLDMTPEWIRVYLARGLCGNSLARLVTNLQKSYNADLGFFDEEATALFQPQSVLAGR
jgi:hypothetical protein